MLKSYFLAKIIRKMQLSSFNKCHIHQSARVASECNLSYSSLGRYSYIGAGTSVTQTEIGDFCSIGSNCQIGGGMHPLNYVSTSPVFLSGRNILKKNFASISYEPYKKVKIGNDVWIGDGCYIKAGVNISSGAVIGAHAVVTHDVGSYEIVAGCPAKLIRKRFDEETINRLNELKWWDWSEEKLKEYGNLFDDVKKFLEISNN